MPASPWARLQLWSAPAPLARPSIAGQSLAGRRRDAQVLLIRSFKEIRAETSPGRGINHVLRLRLNQPGRSGGRHADRRQTCRGTAGRPRLEHDPRGGGAARRRRAADGQRRARFGAEPPHARGRAELPDRRKARLARHAGAADARALRDGVRRPAGHRRRGARRHHRLAGPRPVLRPLHPAADVLQGLRRAAGLPRRALAVEPPPARPRHVHPDALVRAVLDRHQPGGADRPGHHDRPCARDRHRRDGGGRRRRLDAAFGDAGRHRQGDGRPAPQDRRRRADRRRRQGAGQHPCRQLLAHRGGLGGAEGRAALQDRRGRAGKDRRRGRLRPAVLLDGPAGSARATRRTSFRTAEAVSIDQFALMPRSGA